MKRVGVFVCHCGTNIGATIDIPKYDVVVRQPIDIPFDVRTAFTKYESLSDLY